MIKVAILILSILLNIFFVFEFYLPREEGKVSNRIQYENQNSNSIKCETQAKIKKEKDYSRVYILPHPPDFPEGKEISVEKIEKKSGYWELIEVKPDGSKVKLSIREDSIEWR
ncbi:hypothetical protein EHQ46_05945 [Leptospira yanagawae]|uniref:Uncharacterized protein n=1 Tax=Leptospira yanagawae TaxID=293069 RepID=A0ABY2M6M6_9LEPT|nr:hypothetical protein [Leptospira yanagawae]TGL23057.1 hypothetical protein EHQ46_05945 [Leptospira yanagawae]